MNLVLEQTFFNSHLEQRFPTSSRTRYLSASNTVGAFNSAAELLAPADELDTLALQLLPDPFANVFLAFKSGTAALDRLRCFTRGRARPAVESELIDLEAALGLGSPRVSEGAGKVLEIEPFVGMHPELPLLSLLPSDWTKHGVWILRLADTAGFYGVAGVCGPPERLWDHEVLQGLQHSARGLTALARLRYQVGCLAAQLDATCSAPAPLPAAEDRPWSANTTQGKTARGESATAQPDPSLAEDTLDAASKAKRQRGDLTVEDLSPREREVAEMLVQGYSGVNIAAACNLSENTVRTYIRRLYRKLGVSNRAELVGCVIGNCGGFSCCSARGGAPRSYGGRRLQADHDTAHTAEAPNGNAALGSVRSTLRHW